MTSLRLCGGAAALLVLVVPASAEPILTFGGTDFEATMGYNTLDPADWPTTQSESPDPDPADSMVFPNDDMWQNHLFEGGWPVDQWWYVLAEQTYKMGSDYPTLHYTIHKNFGSVILASYPLMIGLQNVNDLDVTELELPGPISGTFTYSLPEWDPEWDPENPPPPFSWSLDAGWTWVPTGDGQYDLEIVFNDLPKLFPGLSENAQIFEVEVDFGVLPEPPTLSLLVVWLITRRHRRRR